MLGWGAVVAIHLLAATAWVGGMFSMQFVLRPSLTGIDDLTKLDITVKSMKRFFFVVWHAMPIMLVTGYMMLFGVYGGFSEAPWSINLMHLLGLGMAGVFMLVYFGPWKDFITEPDPAMLERIRNLITINLVLGIITIVLGGLSSFAGG